MKSSAFKIATYQVVSSPRMGKLVGEMKLFGGDSSEVDSDDSILRQQFKDMSSGTDTLLFKNFYEWEEIQALMADNVCDEKSVKELWTRLAGAIESPINYEQFLEINEELDEKFDALYGESDGVDAEDNKIEVQSGVGFAPSISDSDIDIWDPQFNPSNALEEDFLLYLNNFYSASIDEGNLSKGLSYDAFASWDDIKIMLAEGGVDVECLKELWKEALLETAKYCKDSAADGDIESSLTEGNINIDTFLRLNIRLDQIMDEISDALENLTDDEVEAYYRKEFSELSQGERLLSYQQLMKWADIAEMVENDVLNADQIKVMWNALPKQPLGSFSKGDSSDMQKIVQSDGITIEAFLAFNTALEDEVSSENLVGDDNNTSSKSSGNMTPFLKGNAAASIATFLLISGSCMLTAQPVLAFNPDAMDVKRVMEEPAQAPSIAKTSKTVKLPSGVEYYDATIGQGSTVEEGKTVQFQWVLRRSNGYFVDSSANYGTDEAGEAFIYRVGNLKKVIPGVDEAIRGMKPGGLRRINIPANKGFLVSGVGDDKPGPMPSGFGPRRQILTRIGSETWYFEIKVTKVK